MLKRDAISDIGQLKDSGVGIVKGKADVLDSEASKNVAEGAKMFGEREQALANANLMDAQAELTREQATAQRIANVSDGLEAAQKMAEAIREADDALMLAMSIISQKGGSVMLDSAQLEALASRQPIIGPSPNPELTAKEEPSSDPAIGPMGEGTSRPTPDPTIGQMEPPTVTFNPDNQPMGAPPPFKITHVPDEDE
ncbi:MAG: hypothetical protein AAF170_04245 [Bacteroidota bacterium]